MRFDPLELAVWTRGRWDPHPPSRPVSGVTQDTRRLRTGDLYVALRGAQHDGHAFVDAARRGGALAALVMEPFCDARVRDWPLLRVHDSKRALFDLASGYRKSLPVRIVGVTGSVGKTTVKEMIAHLLQGSAGAGLITRTPGNWNNDIGVPLSLLQTPPEAAFGIFEAGTNHPGEMRPLAELLQPDIGVVTTVGVSHMQHFGSTAAIAREKAELLRVLPPAGLAVLNRDHADFAALQAAAPCRVVTVSMQAAAGYRGLAVQTAENGDLCLEFIDPQGQHRTLRAALSGRHQAANLLLAVATVREIGADWEALQAALGNFQMPGMRWQKLTRAGVTVINDAYNANPVSMQAALTTFAAQAAATGHRWLVLGDMLELGGDSGKEHRAIGRLVAQGRWEGLVTVGAAAVEIADGAREAGFPSALIWTCRDAAAAADVVRERLRPGDALLLKGSRGVKLESIIPLIWGNGSELS